MILSILDPRKCEYLKDYSSDFERPVLMAPIPSLLCVRIIYTNFLKVCVISGVRHDVNEIGAVLGYYVP